MQMPIDELKKWFLENRRSFPWRENPTPYRVWISEVMLQQTGASVVIPYFEKWVRAFPTIYDLAQASEESVIKMWEGLGYYSRARYLREAAIDLAQNHAGELPSDPELLSKIKGIGPYTQSAILSFAFHKKAAAIDGNVMRLFSRLFALKSSIDSSKTKQEIAQLGAALLPENEPWIISEAFIELGATVCKSKPLCPQCPLISSCLAYREGIQGELPLRKKRAKTIPLYRAVAVVICGEYYLIQKNERGKVMGELYEFPFLEMQNDKMASKDILELFEEKLQMKLTYQLTLPKVEHHFTKYHAFLSPFVFKTEKQEENLLWKRDLHALAFSSGHRRILNSLGLLYENIA